MARLETQPEHLKRGLNFHKPFGFNDYIRLQQSAKLVLSDSGTISEESSLLGFPAVTLRDTIERPEAIDVGAIITAGVGSDAILDAVRITLRAFEADGRPTVPADYQIQDTSRRVVNFIRSTVHSHKDRLGLR